MCQISVILPVYNGEKFIGEAIESILNQTFTDFELIIINDCSIDNTEDIVFSYKDKRIRYYKNERNLQLIASLNKGIKLSTGKYVARMDADDIALSKRLYEQFVFMEDNLEIVACGTWAISFGNSREKLIKVPVEHSSIFLYSFLRNPIIHPTVMIRKCYLSQNNLLYSHEFKHAEDYKLWVDLMKLGKLANIPKVLLKYRLSSDQISNKFAEEQRRIATKIKYSIIQEFIGPYSASFKIENPIGLNMIKEVEEIEVNVRQEFDAGDISKNEFKFIKKVFNSCKMVLYLSMDLYSIKSLFHFIFSFNYLYYPYNLSIILKIIKRHLF